MKNKYLLLFFPLFLFTKLYSQSAGDIAFIGFNTDGDKDFSIVVLADINPNKTIYFTDDETTGSAGVSGLAGSEGTITWSTGNAIINAGTVVVFTDVDSAANPNFGASVGSITRSGTFGLSGSKDGLIAFIGSDEDTPTTYLAALQIGNNNAELGPFDGDGITLTNTGLVVGSTIVVVDNVASPDGGKYSGARNSQSNFSDYKSLIVDNTNNWTTVSSSGDGETLLPFSSTAFTITSNITWTGATDNNWNTDSNWSTNTVPNSTNNVIIPNGLTNYPTISSATTVNSISIASGATLIANATVTANVTYKRSLTNTNWYLISPPVTGQTNNDLIEKNNLASGSGGNLGIGTYNNNGATAWSYLNASSTGSIDDGTGKSVKLGAAGDITFTGSLNNTSINKAITTGDRNNYNLVGNPFTSYVNLGTFLTENNTPLSEQTVWLWNENTNSYDVKMLGTHASFEIAPGQGFFVSANSDTNISFNATNQSHQNSDTFQRSTNTQVNLYVKEGKNNKKTEIYYIEGTTKGFDNGYDGTVFSGVSSKFSVYSQLVNDNKGKNYAIQSLPLIEMENITIPIGLKVEANKEIEFSSTSMNLPDNIKVYLEDKINNQFIDITENTYKVTLNEAADGIGQFYLRTSSRDLNIPLATSIEEVNIYKSSNNTITISGLEATNASLKVYSLLGQIVSTQKFSSNGISTLNIPSLTTGVYIVELNSALGKISKKIILK